MVTLAGGSLTVLPAGLQSNMRLTNFPSLSLFHSESVLWPDNSLALPGSFSLPPTGVSSGILSLHLLLRGPRLT